MKNKLLPILLIIILTSTTLYLTTQNFSTNAIPGQGDWIKSFNIQDATTGDLILSQNFETGTTSGNGQISNGDELKVTVTINIGVNNPSSTLSLSTSMNKIKDIIWEHNSGDGYSLGNYNPGANSFTFSQTAGTLTITCYGKVSGNVAQTAGGVTLHKSVPVVLVALKSPSGDTLDEVRRNITDASINAYNTKLAEQQNKLANLRSQSVSPAITELWENVIQESQTVAEAGLTDNALGMLNSLDTAAAPASATMEILFIPLVIIFAVIAAVLGFLFMKARSKVGYFKLVVEDQIKDLEGISIRAAKIDRSMGSNLESVKDRLKRLVGM